MTVAQLTVKLGVDGMGQIVSALDKVKTGLGQVAQKAQGAGTGATARLLLAATGGGAVFSVGWSVYNRVLRKKLIGLVCGGCEGRQTRPIN